MPGLYEALDNLNFFYPSQKPFSVKFFAEKIGMIPQYSVKELINFSLKNYIRLTSAKITFETTDDDKDHDTAVFVYVRSRNDGKLLAYIENADSSEYEYTNYKDHSEHSISLSFDRVRKADCEDTQITIGSHPVGRDCWMFDAKVELFFIDGSIIKRRSEYTRILASDDEYVSTDIDGPPGASPSPYPPSPCTVYLSHPNTIMPKQYQNGMNYYGPGGPLGVLPATARITKVQNTCKYPAGLWYEDKAGEKKFSDVAPPPILGPGEITFDFNQMYVEGIWEAIGPIFNSIENQGISLLVSWE
jgi:hypothetical protein